jgi:hypothetical protein
VVDVVVVVGGSVVGGTLDSVVGADASASGKDSGSDARVAASTSSTTSTPGLATVNAATTTNTADGRR